MAGKTFSGGPTLPRPKPSLVPFLFSNEPSHRAWLYGYRDKEQIIRGVKVMRDGRGKWWDVESTPDDLISFPLIMDWSEVSAEHRDERDRLKAILPRFDQDRNGRNAPGHDSKALEVSRGKPGATLAVSCADHFDGRDALGDGDYSSDETGRVCRPRRGVEMNESASK